MQAHALGEPDAEASRLFPLPFFFFPLPFLRRPLEVRYRIGTNVDCFAGRKESELIPSLFSPLHEGKKVSAGVCLRTVANSWFFPFFSMRSSFSPQGGNGACDRVLQRVATALMSDATNKYPSFPPLFFLAVNGVGEITQKPFCVAIFSLSFPPLFFFPLPSFFFSLSPTKVKEIENRAAYTPFEGTYTI